MPVLRIVTDINVKDYPSTEDITKVTTSMHEYAHGVVTTIQMEGDEPVRDRGAHIHSSTEDELCYDCRGLSRDGVS